MYHLMFRTTEPHEQRTSLAEPDDDHRYFVWRPKNAEGKWLAMRYTRRHSAWGPDHLGMFASCDAAMKGCDRDYAARTKSCRSA